jgi:hypothetical protein
MIQLSMIDANDFLQTATLDDTVYKLHYSWNDYAQQWTVGLRDAHGNDIIRSIAIAPNFPLFLIHHRESNVPRGELMAVVVDENNAENQKISRDDFINGRFSMVYIPEVELNALRTG